MVENAARFDIELVAGSDEARLRLSGDLDADTACSLAAAGGRLISDGHRQLVLDCAQLTFCDSYGIRAMIRLRDQIHPDGKVTVTDASKQLARVLQITGLEELLAS